MCSSLNIKLINLNTLIEAQKENLTIDGCAFNMLIDQLGAMNSYKNILVERINSFESTNDLTVGEELIGSFNNTGNINIDEIKLTAAHLVNLIDKYGVDERRKSVAKTNIETGIMYAVKSFFK